MTAWRNWSRNVDRHSLLPAMPAVHTPSIPSSVCTRMICSSCGWVPRAPASMPASARIQRARRMPPIGRTACMTAGDELSRVVTVIEVIFIAVALHCRRIIYDSTRTACLRPYRGNHGPVR